MRGQPLRQFEVGSSGLFVLSSLVSGPFSVNTQTFIGDMHFCINTCMECTVCTVLLMMILCYVLEEVQGIKIHESTGLHKQTVL